MIIELMSLLKSRKLAPWKAAPRMNRAPSVEAITTARRCEAIAAEMRLNP